MDSGTPPLVLAPPGSGGALSVQLRDPKRFVYALQFRLAEQDTPDGRYRIWLSAESLLRLGRRGGVEDRTVEERRTLTDLAPPPYVAEVGAR